MPSVLAVIKLARARNVMIAIMWQFDVKKGREGEFEQCIALMCSRLLRDVVPRLLNPLSRWEFSQHSMCPIVRGRRGHSETGLKFLPSEPLAVSSQISCRGCCANWRQLG